jgi:DNA-binding winged helix-turn-helix (wHTH) protein
MRALATRDIFMFADFRLDRRSGGLFRRSEDGAEVPVALGSRAFDILSLLLERAGDLVSKDEITAIVWQGAVVEESNLTVHIAALRRILDEDRAQGSCIQTVVGRGYRFVAEVARLDAEGAAGAPVTGGTTPRPIGDAQRPVLAASGLWSSRPCNHRTVDGFNPGSGPARHDRCAAPVDCRAAVWRFQRPPQSAKFRRPDD